MNEDIELSAKRMSSPRPLDQQEADFFEPDDDDFATLKEADARRTSVDQRCWTDGGNRGSHRNGKHSLSSAICKRRKYSDRRNTREREALSRLLHREPLRKGHRPSPRRLRGGIEEKVYRVLAGKGYYDRGQIFTLCGSNKVGIDIVLHVYDSEGTAVAVSFAIDTDGAVSVATSNGDAPEETITIDDIHPYIRAVEGKRLESDSEGD